jgi:putative endonuclease
MKTYSVYILASRTRVLYIGITGDLEKRLAIHRAVIHADSFTARYKCTRLVHVELFTRVSDALAREKELKGWRRDKKLRLIEIANPNWDDLAPPLRPGPSLRSG